MRKISVIFFLFKIAYINSAYSNDIDKVLCKRVIDNGKIISSNDNIKNRRINTYYNLDTRIIYDGYIYFVRYKHNTNNCFFRVQILSNVNEIPSLEKIIINIGDGKAATDGRALESMVDELTAISGQKPLIRRAKKSIAGFKIREGMPIGTSVTLRGDRMWEFYDRFVQVVVPRIRDFRGFNKKSFDGNGNYTLGLNEQLVFPEVEYDKVRDIRGMNITICTSANDNEKGYVLLQSLGFPFREN